jgi:long-chain acyl-CoA synthetase
MEKIWLKSYPSGVPADIDIDHIPSLVALFEKACKTFADKVAYISMGREITYRQLDAEATEFAGWLQAKGVISRWLKMLHR